VTDDLKGQYDEETYALGSEPEKAEEREEA
jgi:hypothetical protein